MQKAEFYFFHRYKLSCLTIIFIGVWHLSFSQHEKVQKQQDSLITIAKKLRYDYPDSAESIARKALLFCYRDGYEFGEAVCNSNIGITKYYLAQYDSSLQYMEAARIIFEKLGDRKRECSTLNNIGSFATSAGDLEKAMIAFTKALSIAQEISFDDEIPKIQNNIGRVYMERTYLGEATHQKAIDHFQASYKLAKDAQLKTDCCINMGIAYQSIGDHTQALHMFEKSLEYSIVTNDKESYTQSLGLIGSHYLKIGNHKEAFSYSMQELKRRHKNQFEDGSLISTYNRLGLIHRELIQFDSAIFYHAKALKLALQINSPILQTTYEYLAKGYQADGKYDSALKYHLKYTAIKDSLIAVENEKQIDDLQVKYEVKAKDGEIYLLQETQRLQTLIIISVIIILIIAVVLAIVLKQKINKQKQLAIKNEEINRQKIIDLLQQQEVSEIRAAIQGQEKERKRIAGELHDSVAGTLAGMKQNIVLFTEKFGFYNELQNLIRITDEVYNEVRGLSHHLVSPKIVATFFTQLLKNHFNDLAINHQLEVRCIVHPEQEINDLPLDIKVELYRIVQELTTNVARHAHAEYVELQMIKTTNALNLIIEDDGKGFDPRKTREGIGLNNIKSRVKFLQGTLVIDATTKRGTTIIVDIPLGNRQN